MNRIALSVFLVVMLVSVCGVVEAKENLRRGDRGSGVVSLPTAPPAIDYGIQGNSRVYQMERIPTALIISVPKTTVYVGDTLTVNARLINVNTGLGIPWAIVRGFFSQDGINWLEPGTLTTDGAGKYSYTGTVPDYPGTYYGYVSYDGNDTYQRCEGSHYIITVLPQPTPVPTLVPIPTSSPNPTSTPNPTLTPDPISIGSNQSATLPISTGSNQSAALGSMPVSASNTTTNVSANTTSSIKPSSSKGSPGFDVMYGFIALAAVVVFLKFRKKLVR